MQHLNQIIETVILNENLQNLKDEIKNIDKKTYMKLKNWYYDDFYGEPVVISDEFPAVKEAVRQEQLARLAYIDKSKSIGLGNYL